MGREFPVLEGSAAPKELTYREAEEEMLNQFTVLYPAKEVGRIALRGTCADLRAPLAKLQILQTDL